MPPTPLRRPSTVLVDRPMPVHARRAPLTGGPVHLMIELGVGVATETSCASHGIDHVPVRRLDLSVPLTEHQIERALERIEPGLTKYLWIMDRVYRCDVRTDATFRRSFNGFYKVRKTPAWQAPYYALMEHAKTQPMGFAEVLRAMHAAVGSIEASFSSKLVATLDPTQPVWDQFVLHNVGLRKPYPYQSDQLGRTIAVYEELRRRYAALVASHEGRLICGMFTQRYPAAAITDQKRIDLVLWQHRD
jgi:hypothetical protein